MSNNISLSRFIRNDATQIRLFDMGRKVSKIRLTDFEKFELGEMAYPYPYQQAGWVGVLFWNNVRFGVGLGLRFVNVFFSCTIVPSASYEFDNLFAAVIRLNATYAKRQNWFKSTILGASDISIYNPIVSLQLSAVFE